MVKVLHFKWSLYLFCPFPLCLNQKVVSQRSYNSNIWNNFHKMPCEAVRTKKELLLTLRVRMCFFFYFLFFQLNESTLWELEIDNMSTQVSTESLDLISEFSGRVIKFLGKRSIIINMNNMLFLGKIVCLSVDELMYCFKCYYE